MFFIKECKHVSLVTLTFDTFKYKNYRKKISYFKYLVGKGSNINIKVTAKKRKKKENQ